MGLAGPTSPVPSIHPLLQELSDVPPVPPKEFKYFTSNDWQAVCDWVNRHYPKYVVRGVGGRSTARDSAGVGVEAWLGIAREWGWKHG